MGIWLPGPGPTSGDDSYHGDATADIVDGGAGNDTLLGDDGDDTLSGGDGDDIIGPGLGVDQVDGGAGNDTVNITEPSFGGAVSNLEGGSGYDTFDASTFGGGLTYSSVSGQPGVFRAADYAAAGFEAIRAGSGSDFFGMGSYGSSLEIWAGAGDDVFVSTAGELHGGDGGDTFVDSLAGSQMYGDGGNDWFWISGDFGAPVASRLVSGGDGHDTLQANISFLIDLQDGAATSGVATFQVSGIEEVQLSSRWGFWSGVGGTDANETFSVMASMDDGSAGVDLLGRGGDDKLSGSLGNDVLDGGDGVDTASFANAVRGVSINLTISGGQETRGAGRDIIKDVENLIGSIYSDTFVGDAEANTFTGGEGNDTLDGGAGNDVLLGGVGHDTIIDAAGSSGVASIDAGSGKDVITLSGAFLSGVVNGAGGIDQLNMSGSLGGVTFTGIEVLNAGGGVLTGATAQFRSFATIRRSEADLSGSVSLALSTGGVLNLANKAVGRDVNIAGSSAIDVITGSTGNDVMDGGAGGDTLNGGAGNDALTGGDGPDTLDGGEGNDTIHGGTGNDTLIGGAGDDAISDTGGGIVAISAGLGDDVITLGTTLASGTVNGGGGLDQLNASGHLRDIVFVGVETLNTGSELITATAAQMEAFDTIRVSAAASASAVSLRLSAAGTINLVGELGTRGVAFTGSAGNDNITTADGNDTISGGLGDDTINARLGDDRILQGAGDGRDIVDAGSGHDTWRLTGTETAETFRIYTRAEALAAGMTGLAAGTEIVVTRDGTNNAAIIAELDNIEEIEINSLISTTNDGNGTVDGGTAGGDTIIVIGDFTTTSLDYSTIRIEGSAAADTIDIAGLTSAHRVVFTSNGGEDAVIGQVRPQDVFDGLGQAAMEAAFGQFDGIGMLIGTSYRQANDSFAFVLDGIQSDATSHTMLDLAESLLPLDLASNMSPHALTTNQFDHVDSSTDMHGGWFMLAEIASITG